MMDFNMVFFTGLDYPGTRWISMYILDDIDGHELRFFIQTTFHYK